MPSYRRGSTPQPITLVAKNAPYAVRAPERHPSEIVRSDAPPRYDEQEFASDASNKHCPACGAASKEIPRQEETNGN